MRFILTALFATLLCACAAVDSEPKLAAYAALGEPCGGMIAGPSQTCAGDNTYCHRDIKDMCGAADAPGICREKPEMCTMDYTPVCGCDGKTYPNECAANSKGVSAATAGECK